MPDEDGVSLARRVKADPALAATPLVLLSSASPGAPERAFTVVVPLLIGLATILFAGAGRIQRWILSHAARSNGLRVSTDGLRLLLFLGGRLARVLPPNLIRGSSSPSARSSP